MVSDTRERIITATNELFRRRGYNGTSLSEVSKAAPATVGSIYHFFPGGKEDLGVAVIDATGGIYRELFESIAGAASDPAQGVLDVFIGAAAIIEETDFIDPCPIGTIAREVASTNEPIRQAAEAAFDSWIAAANGFLVSSGIRTGVAHDLATLFVTMTEGGFVLCRTKRSVEPLHAVARATSPLISAALQSAPPDRSTV